MDDPEDLRQKLKLLGKKKKDEKVFSHFSSSFAFCFNWVELVPMLLVAVQRLRISG